MSISISGSSVILGEDSGASEIVFDLNFRDMANQDLSAGVNELSDGTNLWVTLVDSPPFHKVVNVLSDMYNNNGDLSLLHDNKIEYNDMCYYKQLEEHRAEALNVAISSNNTENH